MRNIAPRMPRTRAWAFAIGGIIVFTCLLNWRDTGCNVYQAIAQREHHTLIKV